LRQDLDDNLPLVKVETPLKEEPVVKEETSKEEPPAVKEETSKEELAVKEETRVKEETQVKMKEESPDKNKVKSEPTANSKRATVKPAPKPKRRKETKEDDIEPRNQWWENVDEDGELINDEKIKWRQLEQHGFLFPPPYKKHNVPLIYDDEEIILSESAEEMATFYAAAIGTDHEHKKIFIENFFKCFTDSMSEKEKKLIVDFDNCDFSLIRKMILDDRETKKARSKEEKEAEARSKHYYQYALVNGIREKVGSYLVEPPSLFRGRGEHPMQGKAKERVPPEECVLNCDPNAPIPRLPEGVFSGHAWKDVLHDDSVTWLAYYDQTRSEEFRKYFFLAGSSGIKGKNDLFKYEKARRLHDKIDAIRKDYTRKIRVSKDKRMRQLGTATYLIDRLALRVGGEKDTDQEADTVGCTSLRVEHVKFDPDETTLKVTFDFLGKDSVRYLNEVTLPEFVYRRLKEFATGKAGDKKIFDRVDPGIINDYFKEFMSDLSAKVFRTYNASATLEEKLDEYVANPDETPKEKAKFYNEANKSVAILCNHQKGVAKTHSGAILKQQEKLVTIVAERNAVREQMSALARGEQRELKEDETWNLPLTELKCKNRIKALQTRGKKLYELIQQKESHKNVSLGTAKVNYMDPRITVAFCKRVGMEVKTMFNATTIAKFPWALSAASDFKFRAKNMKSIAETVKEYAEVTRNAENDEDESDDNGWNWGSGGWNDWNRSSR